MNPAVSVTLKENLQSLNLSQMAKELESFLRQARESGMDYAELLLQMTDHEMRIRADNRLKRRLKEAKFPLIKTIEGFDFEITADLDRRLIRELCSGEYVKEHKNVIFLGKSGTGKTHLATALGVEACRQGVRTRFVTACGLVNELIEARQEKDLQRILKRYGRYGLLILDELGYIPFSQEGAELLFQVLAERHERGSVIITSNLGFGDWTQVFGDANLTAALLDRLTHKAHIIECSWQSYRLQEALQGQANN
ncbi:IS21-like element helper ATPase IstB [Desulfohalobium retbaense]|jgi:DNA replication protein DnaC|uniref:IstB domain protein ATP-binding protein n=1 Tax=Desulfohalobium retbaense (strain ATCC 49708 / DSM 5692 / JCM 16813 / HR100) TaxID=485915 RepID=C8X1K6_DESRD|nr:IS21-like element helper ATPase IstB [Desulfohalobium retbaense]ACV68303.1 IstB domain protein ATP-binding protein [Desulfohalobium retbaense DSM 5692]ACV68464.1 IstB domain protein ATP-binding protein [Desulfohalobium retbaense DSM 5692]ACV68786.1 IstB domain protein ATP-binding protein [Desulfohalobium retbaense DSM 5692]